MLTFQQSGLYRDEITLYRATLEKNPDSRLARYNLGVALGKQGRREEAIEQYNEAVRIKPDYMAAHINLGVALAKSGRPEGGASSISSRCPDVIRITPRLKTIGARRLLKIGRPEEAVVHYERALQIRPDYFNARFNLMLAYARANRPSEAVATARTALELARSHHRPEQTARFEKWLNSYRCDQSL